MHTPKITIIAAISENRGLGKDNLLLWKIAQDLQFFKRTTMGNPIIMGSKTFESIGKALPKRLNIVVTRSQRQWAGCQTAATVEQAISIAQNHLQERIEPISPQEATTVAPEIFIIGGAQIYTYALAQGLVQRILLTHIHANAPADAFFPDLDTRQWQEISREMHFDNEQQIAFDFVEYVHQRQ